MKVKTILFFFGTAVLLSIVVLWFFSRNPKQVFSYTAVTYRDIQEAITVSGKLMTEKEIEIKPRISANVSEICVETGEKVHKGQILMTLKTIPDISLLEDADVNLELARITLRQAETDFERAEKLYVGKAISAKEYEVFENALTTAKEKYAYAFNKRSIISDGGSKRSPENDASTVRSPIDGIVTEILVHEGGSVSPGITTPGTILCRVADCGELHFKGYVDEIDVASIKEGTKAKLTLGALPKDTILADISSISSFGRTHNGFTQFEIKAVLTQIPEGVLLRSGYSANAEIETGHAEHILSVPEECIRFDKDLKPFVLRLISDPEDLRHQKWESIPVQLGVSNGLVIQIISGLNENDLIQTKLANSI